MGKNRNTKEVVLRHLLYLLIKFSGNEMHLSIVNNGDHQLSERILLTFIQIGELIYSTPGS